MLEIVLLEPKNKANRKDGNRPTLKYSIGFKISEAIGICRMGASSVSPAAGIWPTPQKLSLQVPGTVPTVHSTVLYIKALLLFLSFFLQHSSLCIWIRFPVRAWGSLVWHPWEDIYTLFYLIKNKLYTNYTSPH